MHASQLPLACHSVDHGCRFRAPQLCPATTLHCAAHMWAGDTCRMRQQLCGHLSPALLPCREVDEASGRRFFLLDGASGGSDSAAAGMRAQAAGGVDAPAPLPPIPCLSVCCCRNQALSTRSTNTATHSRTRTWLCISASNTERGLAGRCRNPTHFHRSSRGAPAAAVARGATARSRSPTPARQPQTPLLQAAGLMQWGRGPNTVPLVQTADQTPASIAALQTPPSCARASPAGRWKQRMLVLRRPRRLGDS